ncbi:hypothetical protein BX600DRAFT_432113 [Xylariales sp. PMI_506]|nr:hypothetical protein BX600DRAFT_432113 [Xylariales sp. PMI_506]
MYLDVSSLYGAFQAPNRSVIITAGFMASCESIAETTPKPTHVRGPNGPHIVSSCTPAAPDASDAAAVTPKPAAPKPARPSLVERVAWCLRCARRLSRNAGWTCHQQRGSGVRCETCSRNDYVCLPEAAGADFLRAVDKRAPVAASPASVDACASVEGHLAEMLKLRREEVALRREEMKIRRRSVVAALCSRKRCMNVISPGFSILVLRTRTYSVTDCDKTEHIETSHIDCLPFVARFHWRAALRIWPLSDGVIIHTGGAGTKLTGNVGWARSGGSDVAPSNLQYRPLGDKRSIRYLIPPSPATVMVSMRPPPPTSLAATSSFPTRKSNDL